MNRHSKLSRAAMIALMVWATVVSSARSACPQEAATSEHREASPALRLPARASDGESTRNQSVGTSQRLLSTTFSLGLIVIAIFAAGSWLRRAGLGGVRTLPEEAFEVLGRRVIEPKVAVHLVRCGSRVLMLGVGPEGVRTLAEIDDPDEVERLTSSCQSQADGAEPLVTIPSMSKTSQSASLNSLARRARAFLGLFAVAFLLLGVPSVHAQSSRRGEAANQKPLKFDERFEEDARPRNIRPAALDQDNLPSADSKQVFSPQQLGLSLKMLALMTVFSLVPSVLMMTTCFVRFTVVLGLLRQAIGTQQGPPNQVLSAICLFLTILVMAPIWQRSYDEGIRPYTNPAPGEKAIDEAAALSRTVAPVRSFMSQQIEKSENSGIVWMLHDFQLQGSAGTAAKEPESYDDVPLTVLAPAYLLSELKVGFLIGFQLFLPFLVIDLVIAAVLTSLGMTALSPTVISLPFKLLLFVLIDGWFLVVGMLLESIKVA